MRPLLWFAFDLLLMEAAFGAAPERIAATRSHYLWDVASGFPGGYISSITQTGDGYLWIGSSKGLVRYGGLTFAHVREKDSSSEAHFPVLGLARDSADQLWAIDDVTHLFRYAQGRLGKPVTDNGRHRHRVAALATSRRGTLLFASDMQGVIEYDHHGAPHVLLDPAATPEWPTALAQTSDGVVWIGTRDSGIFRLSLARGVPEIEHVPGMPFAKINCLLPIAESTLLVGSSQGLVRLRNGQLIPETRPELNSQEILALTRGLRGEVWISTGSRLFKIDANDIANDGEIQALDQLPVHSQANALFEDRDGNLWIGGPDTLECYREDGFDTYSAGLPASNCGAIYVDEQGSAWLAPWDGGLFRLSKGWIEPVTVAGLQDDAVYSIDGSAGEIWVGRKYGGVTRLRQHGGALESVTFRRRDGVAQDSVYSIYRAPDGTVWTGTLNQGLSRFRGKTWHTFTTRDGLPSNTISAVTGNASGKVFVGTPNGLAELNKNGWVSYTAHDGLPPGAIESLLPDPAGTLWIGTAKGIAFLQSGAIHVPLSAPDPLYGEILGMAESNGWLWITSGTHVLRVKCEALLKDSFQPGDYREFGVANGLASVEGVKRSRSVVNDSRGRVWFSLHQGISVLLPSAFTRPAFPVTVSLDGVLVDGKLLPPDGEVRVPAGQRRLTFRYGAVNLSNPEDVRYRYRLDKVDSGWSGATAVREVDYTNVSPGRFQFHVEARNPDGFWSRREAVMTFEVDPAFWQDRRYQSLGIAGLFLLAWSLYRLRLRQITATIDLRHAERLAERTRVARELHDTLLQSFHGLMLHFQAVSKLLPEGRAREQLEETMERADQAIAEGRSAVYDLRSSATATNDLAEAVNAVGNELCSDNSAAFNMTVEGPTRDLQPSIRDEIYRISREALSNACKHAHARHIEAEISYGPREFRLRIRDDGEGIPAEVLEQGRAGHFGLRGIRERAEQIGAELTIWSRLDSGTEIDLSLAGSIAYATPLPRSRFRLLQQKVR
jgi:ligand-binding sensor domain-containing protein/signal transduction histidine kinase